MTTSEPRLYLTSMCGPSNVDNITEMVEPILEHLDGIIWVLNDVPVDDPGARYLESVKGSGLIIHRNWTPRHCHSMNETLFCGVMEEGSSVLWVDVLERPMKPFVSRIKSEIRPMMDEADVDLIAAWGKPYLFRYHETLEYRNSPHWSLHGWNDRGIEWSTIEPDEKLVRFNARPLKRLDPLGWVKHYGKYWLYPAGCNHAALGIERYARPGESHQAAFQRREGQRLAFRAEMRRRGLPLTEDGLKTLLTGPLDETLRSHLRAEKTLSDLWHLYQGNGARLKDTHSPQDALPIP